MHVRLQVPFDEILTSSSVKISTSDGLHYQYWNRHVFAIQSVEKSLPFSLYIAPNLRTCTSHYVEAEWVSKLLLHVQTILEIRTASRNHVTSCDIIFVSCVLAQYYV